MRPNASRKLWLFLALALLTMARPLQAEENQRGRELRRQLGETIDFSGIDDARATLADVLENISKRYNLNFDLNEEAFRQANREEAGKFEIAQTPMLPRRAKLGTVLQKVLNRVSPSATYLIRGDQIEVTTTEAIRKEFFADRPETPGPLPPLVSAEFDKVPLEAAFKELNHYGNIVLDGRTAKEGQTPVSADLANVPLDTTVRMLADMAGLKVVKLDNALYVTSKDNARALMEEQEKQNLEKERELKEKTREDKEKAKAKKLDEKPAKK
jgi:hypothetical protein